MTNSKMRLRFATLQNSFTGHLTASPSVLPVEVHQRVKRLTRSIEPIREWELEHGIPKYHVRNPPFNSSLTTASLFLKIGLRISI
jgi:hypothetical protein